MSKEAFWKRVVGEGWYNFYPELWNSSYMENVLTIINNKYKNATIYPEMTNLFKAFKLCPFNEFKVLILGQDPYPNEVNGKPVATGLAFANSEETLKLSPSLVKIHETLERDCYDGFNIHFDTTLEEWAKQGVLLLNTSLTFEKYKGGHFEIWKDFIKAFLIKINEINGCHICLWGNHAKGYKQFLNEKMVYIYEEVHPAYAARNNIDWKCNHFKEINKRIFEQNGKEEIIAW